MAQVIGNLLQNAAKFSREGGKVTVGAAEIEGRAEIRVRDDGVGIAPDLLPRVFDPFVQAEGGLARSAWRQTPRSARGSPGNLQLVMGGARRGDGELGPRPDEGLAAWWRAHR